MTNKIDEMYLNNAKYIRNEYNKTLVDIDKYSFDIKKLADYMMVKKDEISVIPNKYKMKSHDEIKKVGKLILDELNNIQSEIDKLNAIMIPLFNKIEQLKKDEDILYNSLKLKYPTLSDDDLITEIQSVL